MHRSILKARVQWTLKTHKTSLGPYPPQSTKVHVVVIQSESVCKVEQKVFQHVYFMLKNKVFVSSLMVDINRTYTFVHQ